MTVGVVDQSGLWVRGALGVTWEQRPDTRHLLNLKSCELQTPLAQDLLAEALADLTPEDLWRYPCQLPLLERLAVMEGLDPSQIMLSAGSFPVIGAIVEALAAPRGLLLVQEPIFDAWVHFAALRGIEVRRCAGVVGRPAWTNTDELEVAMRASPPSVVAIANPTNPVGDLLPLSHLHHLAEIAGESGHLLVLDDCYGGFEGTEHLRLIEGYEHVLIVRSLSKTWALAGARLAMTVGRASLIDYLQRFRLDAAVSAPALAVAFRLAGMPERLADVRADVTHIRTWFVNSVAEVHPEWSALPSTTNFVTFDTGRLGGGDAVASALFDAGIRVRSVEDIPGLEGCVRFSMAGRHDLNRVLAKLSDHRSGAEG